MIKNIRSIWIIIYFDWLVIIFHHFYNFNLKIFCSCYEHNFVQSKDWWLFSNPDWGGSERFCSHFQEYFESIRKEQNLRKVAKSLCLFLTRWYCKNCFQKSSPWRRWILKKSWNDDKIEKQEHIAEKIIPPEKKRQNIKQIEKSIIKMEHYRIYKLLNDSTVSKFVTKKMGRSKGFLK